MKKILPLILFTLLLPFSCLAVGKPISATALATDANLVNYYKFLGNSLDSKGAANGIDTSIVYSTNFSPFGGATEGAFFNNPAGGTATSFIRASFLAPGAGAFTYYTWVEFNAVPAATLQAFMHNEANGASGRPSLQLYFDGTNFMVSDNDSTTGTTNVSSSGVTVAPGVWYQVAATRSGGTLSLYINGILVGSGADSLTSIATSNGNFGRRFNTTYGSLRGFNGDIADTATFSRALTATEIANLYSSFSFSQFFPF